MKILKKIINITLIVSIFLLLPIVVFTLITSRTNLISDIQSFVVLTGSMQPKIPVGSVIYAQKQNSYNNGDVIAFGSGNNTVTHRIVNVKNDGSYITRGDANNTNDANPVFTKDILGKQIFSLPYLGKLIIFLKTPLGFFGSIVFPITVFIVLELWNIKKEIEKEAEKRVRKDLGLQTV